MDVISVGVNQTNYILVADSVRKGLGYIHSFRMNKTIDN